MLKVKCFRNTFFGYVRNCQTSSSLNKLIRGKYKPLNTLIHGYNCPFTQDDTKKLQKSHFRPKNWGKWCKMIICQCFLLYLICQITSETVQKNSQNEKSYFRCISISANRMHPKERVTFSFNLVDMMNLKSFQNKEPLRKRRTGVLIENFKHLKVIWTDKTDC